jgi:hypothetical protein
MQQGGPYNGNYWLGLVDNVPHVFSWSDGGDSGTATAINDNQWHHLVLTVEGTTGRLYVDGVEKWSGLYGHTTAGAALAIGGHGVFGQSYTGSIDEAAVWNRALLASDVALLSTGSPVSVIAETAAAITTTSISRLVVIPTPTIAAVRNVSITATTVAAVASVYTPTVAAVRNVVITTATVARQAAIPTPVVDAVRNPAVTTTTVTAISSVSQPTKSATAALTTSVVATVTTVPASTASTAASVAPTTLARIVAMTVPTVSGTAAVTPSSLTRAVTIPTPSVSTAGNTSVEPATVSVQMSVPQPTVDVVRNVSITLTTVTVAASVYQPSSVAADAAPLAPPNVTVTPVSATELFIEWDPVSGASHYLVERDGVLILESEDTNTYYSDGDLVPSTTYRYRVRGDI